MLNKFKKNLSLLLLAASAMACHKNDIIKPEEPVTVVDAVTITGNKFQYQEADVVKSPGDVGKISVGTMKADQILLAQMLPGVTALNGTPVTGQSKCAYTIDVIPRNNQQPDYWEQYGLGVPAAHTLQIIAWTTGYFPSDVAILGMKYNPDPRPWGAADKNNASNAIVVIRRTDGSNIEGLKKKDEAGRTYKEAAQMLIFQAMPDPDSNDKTAAVALGLAQTDLTTNGRTIFLSGLDQIFTGKTATSFQANFTGGFAVKEGGSVVYGSLKN